MNNFGGLLPDKIFSLFKINLFLNYRTYTWSPLKIGDWRYSWLSRGRNMRFSLVGPTLQVFFHDWKFLLFKIKNTSYFCSHFYSFVTLLYMLYTAAKCHNQVLHSTLLVILFFKRKIKHVHSAWQLPLRFLDTKPNYLILNMVDILKSLSIFVLCRTLFTIWKNGTLSIKTYENLENKNHVWP